MGRNAQKRSAQPILDEATTVPMVRREDFDRAMNLAEEMAKRIALLEATVQDLIPYATEGWERHSGTLFGVGGGAVLNAMRVLGIPRVARSLDIGRRLANVAPPLMGEFALGDFIAIGDRVCKVKKAHRLKVILEIVGKVES